ncbi:MAG: ATP-dependent Clp protease adapter ClpS [Dehalococcoidia bacterium]
MTSPATETTPDVRIWADLLPPYRVILHNDDVNSMDHVVAVLLRTIPRMSPEGAYAIMIEAHTSGQAEVIVCPLEQAELYRERLESHGLTSTIERAG